jgi:hypothetical protein
MNFVDLAQQAVQHLRPELLLLAGKTVGGAATESGKQLVSWFRAHLKSPAAQAALTDAATHPDDDRRITSLQLQIEILLEENESFRQALAAFLKTLPAPHCDPPNRHSHRRQQQNRPSRRPRQQDQHSVTKPQSKSSSLNSAT